MQLINGLVVKMLPLFPRYFVSAISRRYIAGETLLEAIAASSDLNESGFMVTLDVLGENIEKLEDAASAKDACIEVLDAIHENGIDGNISIKLTQFGLKIDKSACIENVKEIIDCARSYGNFVRIDMEDSTCTDDTIDICLQMVDYYDRVGVVIQAYLKRSEDDVKMLSSRGINLRICKGIYVESGQIAYKDPDKIRQNFARLLEIMVEASAYIAIATHDPMVIEKAKAIISNNNVPISGYEYQMLLGVAQPLRQQLVENGNRLRVYVPFGRHWYSYSTRRLKENPQIAGHIIQNLFKK